MLINQLKKYRFLYLSILATGFFLIYYNNLANPNTEQEAVRYRKQFAHQEKLLEQFLDNTITKLASTNTSHLFWKTYTQHSPYFIHIYQHDSLIGWNTNQLPVNRFSDIHFPTNGIAHLQNGWYYSHTRKQGKLLVCATFLVAHDYAYENSNLINDFNPKIKPGYPAAISMEEHPDYAVYDLNHHFLFSIIPKNSVIFNNFQSGLLTLLLLLIAVFWIKTLFDFQQKLSFPVQLIILTGSLILRFLSLKFNWLNALHDLPVFQPSLYGTNESFPSFFDFLLNIILLNYLSFSILNAVKNKTTFSKGKNRYFHFLLIIPFILFIPAIQLIKGLVENSSIPLSLERLFSLNFYSFLAITAIGFVLFPFFRITQAILDLNKANKNKAVSLVILLIGAIIVYIFLPEFNTTEKVIAVSLPLATSSILLLFNSRKKALQFPVFGITFLALFSLFTAISLNEYNSEKDLSERELYTSQLATEQDIATEVEYSKIITAIDQDNNLKKLIDDTGNQGVSGFENGLERRIFNGFWDRYDLNFYLFDTSGISLISNKSESYQELSTILQRHSRRSEINPDIYYITDYTNLYSYLIRQKIYGKNGKPAWLFCTLKSKKIPEEIGFPRLLISGQQQVFNPLEKYAIARYYNGRLTASYGSYNFPSTADAILSWSKTSKNLYLNEGYSHYLLEKTPGNIIVLSEKELTIIDQFTSFSYLFIFYGFLLLPVVIKTNRSRMLGRNIQLSSKIQLVSIGLVLLALLAFGWGSGLFVFNQYKQLTNSVIREKLISLDIELKSKLGNENKLSIQKNGSNVEYQLQKLSKIFITDVNLYDQDGFLIGSSRSKVFNMGLLSEQMNPDALRAFRINNYSEFIHNEQIGNLQYISAYSPFYSNEGKQLGYLNLQHFGQQEEIENQIQQFLISIINIFMLLLVISVVVAIFASDWVTRPLRILQEKFATVHFGKKNQQILYEKNDEIGALVKDYNQKLEELEHTANQLAQSERESAWRDMARQVAHEIKNPLTPMKLSVQHLLRSYDASDPNSELKIRKVSESLIEQIDALTRIANEFSNFAQMPLPVNAEIDLIPILSNVCEVFQQESDQQIIMENKSQHAIINGDKDQMIRIFNNLIKNALQAIPTGRKGKIEIHTKLQNGQLFITLKDNGTGIQPEDRERLFTPYFTTKSTGTGLGLSMTKQIIENHGGSIRFESVINQGTTFYISLPVIQQKVS